MAEKVPGEEQGLPPGLEPMPELGPDVVGARVRAGVTARRWAYAAAFAVVSVVVVAGVPTVVGWAELLVLMLVLSVMFVAATVYWVLVARHGTAPALTVDGENVRALIPFSRVTVRVAAIKGVTQLRQDLLLDAPGGVERRGHLTRARWAPLYGVKALGVDRAALADYLRARAESARG